MMMLILRPPVSLLHEPRANCNRLLPKWTSVIKKMICDMEHESD